MAMRLGGVSFRHGAWRDLKDLRDRGLATGAQVEQLRMGGLSRYSVIDGAGVPDLYAECVNESLIGLGLIPSDIDAVLFFSSTFSTYSNHEVLIQFCQREGLTQALPIGIFEAQCTNFSYALMIARGLIAADGMRHVLLLGSDVLDESQATRVITAGGSVFSDSVLSAVVGPDLDQGFLVEHIGHVVEPSMAVLDPARETLRFLDTFAACLHRVCNQAFTSTGLRPEDIEYLVLANLAVPVLRNYAAVAGIPFDRVVTDNIPRFGHCFAHDQLITLETLVRSGVTSPGQRALVLGVGASHLFSAGVLRIV